MVKIEQAAEKLENIVSEESAKFTSEEKYKERLSLTLQEYDEISGGELVSRCLEALAPENPGINEMAEHHGGAILPFYAGMVGTGFSKNDKPDMNDLHSPHEQIAGFIAKGYANAGSSAGVAVATSGPGATNLITSFYDSFMDSSPVVYITGNVTTTAAGSMAFQEAPIKKMVTSVAKKVSYMDDIKNVPAEVYDAFRTALEGRPGPVWLDIPKDINNAKVSPDSINFSREKPYVKMNSISRIDTLAEKLEASERPVIYAGGGVKMGEAWDELRDFAIKNNIPVTTTLKGKGVFPESHDLSLRMLGMHGTVYANYAVDESDLLIAVGARFDDRVTGDPEMFARNAYIAHIDIDPRGIGPNGRQPELTIMADVKKALGELSNINIQASGYTEWHDTIKRWKTQYPLDYDRNSKVFKPQHAVEIIHELTEGTHSIVADVGQNQMWAAQFYPTDDPYGFDTSAGAGTMGCSMPQALGAYLNKRQTGDSTPVSVITGEEGFMMNPQTLLMYERIQPDIKVFVIDNKEEDGTPGGMVRQWYDMAHGGIEWKVKGRFDIARAARGFGVSASEATTPEEAYREIGKALNTPGPYVVNLKVDPEENCLPMMPPGGTVDDIIMYQDG